MDALQEAIGDDTAAPEVREVLKAGRVPGRLATLEENERLVAFDHGGHEAIYDASDSIQSMESTGTNS